MSQHSSCTTLSPICYSPRDENGTNPWTSKSKLEFRPVTTKITQMPIEKRSPNNMHVSRQGSLTSSPGTSPRFPLHEITQMNKELGTARQKGEMPKTKASPLNEEALIQDYASLLQLREARGDAAKPPSQEYTQVRVDVARRIKERDDRSDCESQDRETQRRVHDYLYSAKKEQFFLSETSSQRSAPLSATFPPEGAGELVEKLHDIVQQASEYFEATEPFLDSLDHHDDSFSKIVLDMRSMCKHFQDIQRQMQANLHHSIASQQHQQYIQQYFYQSMTSQHHALHHHLSSAHALTAHLHSLIEPQARAMQASTENLALHTGIITHLSEQLRTLPTIIQRTVQQTVHNAVQLEVRAATRQIMEAQQDAMLSLLEPQVQPQLPRGQIRCNSRRSGFFSKVKGFFRAQPCS